MGITDNWVTSQSSPNSKLVRTVEYSTHSNPLIKELRIPPGKVRVSLGFAEPSKNPTTCREVIRRPSQPGLRTPVPESRVDTFD